MQNNNPRFNPSIVHDRDDSFDDEDEEDDVDLSAADIASHYGQVDHYRYTSKYDVYQCFILRDTWRRVRDTEAVKGSILPDSSVAGADSPAVSSESTWPSQQPPQSLSNGLSSFV